MDYYFKVSRRFKIDVYKFYKDNCAQGASELILLLGGILVVILILTHIYKSYLSDFMNNLNDNEINELNNSFSNLGSKFE
ncbi:MAG: class III signal peptide-containing protein [archaeon]|nr:class III signal peptide-containing protein [archaeon]